MCHTCNLCGGLLLGTPVVCICFACQTLICGALCDRDVDGTCCLLDALAAPRVSGKKQQDVLSTLAFLTSGSELNAGSVVASRGMATLVPLLLKRSEKTVTGAARVIANVLVSPAGQVRSTLTGAVKVVASVLGSPAGQEKGCDRCGSSDCQCAC